MATIPPTYAIATVYSALWLVADYRATVLRPILVGDGHIHIRAGFGCTLKVPLDQVVAVGPLKPDFGRESVNLTLLGTPTHWLSMAEPMNAEGPYGFRRRVRAIGITPDEDAAFDRVIADRPN